MLLAVVPALILTLICMGLAARYRGVWTDEIWTLWMTQRDMPLADVFQHRWTQDLHPFFFFGLNWLMRPWLGESIVVGRLLNLLPLLAVAATMFVLSRRQPRLRTMAPVFLVLVLANHWAIAYFAEYRSYFSGLCFTVALLSAIYCVLDAREDFSASRDALLGVMLFAWGVAALLIHYVASVVVGTLMAVVALDLLRRRRFGWAAILIASLACAGVLLAACLYEARRYLLANTVHFWISTSPIHCLQYLATLSGSVPRYNPVAGVAAAVGLWINLRPSARAPEEPERAFSRRYLTVVGAGLLAGMAAVFGLNCLKPIAQVRYMISIEAITASLVAVASADVILKRAWIAALFALAAMTSSILLTIHPIHDRRWDYFADLIKTQVKSCPDTIVYGLDEAYFLDYAGSVANEPEVQAWGYRYMARSRGFSIRWLDPSRPAPIVLSATCPTVFWGAHINPKTGPPQLRSAPFTQFLPPRFSWARTRLVLDPHPDFMEKGFMVVAPGQAPAGQDQSTSSPGRLSAARGAPSH